MSALCFFGIHRFCVESVERFSEGRDFSDHVWGNVAVRERCARCKRVRYATRYQRPTPPHTEQGER